MGWRWVGIEGQGMQISIKTNFPEVQRAMDTLQRDIAGKAMASAINKSIALAKTQMTREIPAEFNVKAGYVRDRLRIRKASAGRGRVVLSAELSASNRRGRGANIIAFVSALQAMSRAKGGAQKQLFVKIKRGGARKAVKGRYGHGGFVGNKGRTVFERTGDKRLPIRAVSTIDVAQMFNTRRINGKVIATINARFADLFATEARYFVARFNQTGK